MAMRTKVNRKTFVLDTNVLIHDPTCIFQFEEHDIYIPMATVEELDKHKRGMKEIARNARQASRYLNELLEGHKGDLGKGVPLKGSMNPEATGRLFFQMPNLRVNPLPNLPMGVADHEIVAVARQLRDENKDAILVAKDTNIRIKARVYGVPAEDYQTDKVIEDSDLVYSGLRELPHDFWERHGKDIECKKEGPYILCHVRGFLANSFYPNEFVYEVKTDGKIVCYRVKKEKGLSATLSTFDNYTLPKHAVWGVTARNLEQTCALNLLLDPTIDFVSLMGQAGTGKTLLALVAGLWQSLGAKKVYDEIIATRATVPVGDEIGYMPGNEEEKMNPWMGAFQDNLEVLKHNDDAQKDYTRADDNVEAKNRLKFKAIQFMRGRTFLNRFLIIDEAQNLTPKEMKTLITRAGPGTKVICMGNIGQIDTPYLTEGSSGLTYVVDKFKEWSHAGHITLHRVERSRLADFAVDAL